MSARLLALFCLAALLSGCRNADDPAAPEIGVEMVAIEADEIEAGPDAFTPVLSGPLRVIAASPRGALREMRPGQGVAVTFSRPMVPLGDAPPPPAGALALEPAVPGTLAWEGTQTLVFRPARPLPSATAFRAVLQPGLTSLDGEPLAQAHSWTFETPRPRLAVSRPADGEPRAHPDSAVVLGFTLPVRAQDVAALARAARGQHLAAFHPDPAR